MILWIISICIAGLAAWMGLKKGAVRAAFTQVGLLLGAIVAVPLGPVAAWLLQLAGLKNAVLTMFAGPIVVYLLVLFAAKFAGAQVHKKIEVFYKYDVPDTLRLAWERLNSRLGFCLGLANGTIYVFILCTLIYIPGYLTVQASNPENEPIVVKAINQLAQDVQSTGMRKAISPFLPVKPTWFEAADVIGLLYHNPLLESRVAHYAGLAPLTDQKEFQDLANDVGFHQAWASQASFLEFFEHPKMKAVLENPALLANLRKIINPDLKDFKEYLVTGQSLKYTEKILGRWDFNLQATLSRARRKPNATTAELARLRKALGATMTKATLSAALDQRVVIKAAGGSSQGTWMQAGSENNYSLSLSEGNKKVEAAAVVDGERLIVTKDGLALVFEK